MSQPRLRQTPERLQQSRYGYASMRSSLYLHSIRLFVCFPVPTQPNQIIIIKTSCLLTPASQPFIVRSSNCLAMLVAVLASMSRPNIQQCRVLTLCSISDQPGSAHSQQINILILQTSSVVICLGSHTLVP